MANLQEFQSTGGGQTRRGVIYFLQAGDCGPIKIGFTKGHPLERAKAIQVWCPYELQWRAFILGRQVQERRIHEQFASDRLHSEWFRPCAALLKFINDECHSFAEKRVIDEWFHTADMQIIRDGLRLDQIGKALEHTPSLRAAQVEEDDFFKWIAGRKAPTETLVRKAYLALADYQKRLLEAA